MTTSDSPTVGGSPVRPDTADPLVLRQLGDQIREALAPPERGDAPSPVADLLRGEVVPQDAVDRVVGVAGRRALVDTGVAVPHGDQLRSSLRGHHLHGVVVLTDPDVPKDARHRWYVDPLWEADLLIRLMLRQGGNTALDMGCGCGVLSLVLAQRYQSVVGVDVNPRAVALSRLNAALNGTSHVRFVEGDLFTPVADADRFDRVVFNSPTNKEGMEFRDLLEAGEPIVERFFTQVPEKLSPRGVVEVNLAMNDYPGDRFRDRLIEWLRIPDSGLRATIAVSQRTPTPDGGEWKRGWAVLTFGRPGFSEWEWTYHDRYEEDPAAFTPDVASLLDLPGLETTTYRG